jgi:glutamyl-tRNA synthetase
MPKPEELEKLVKKYALANAVNHHGQAQQGAVMGLIMSKHPQYRKEAAKVSQIVAEIIDEINQLPPEDQKTMLEDLGGFQDKKKIVEKGLTSLPSVTGEVVLRFAPNPSGPLHIGHSRAAILNQEYRKRYQGKLILRVEDTDPRRVDPQAYQMIEQDLTWLGITWNQQTIQSDRIKIYYEQAEKLIKKGGAYMCTCPGDVFKELKDSSRPCHHREMSTEENLALWQKMPSMDEGQIVMRVKTDLNHKNPAIRDWVAMRIVDTPHPRIGNKYRVYPMMNFAVAVDDHLMGVTHVLRGKDHLANSEKQEYLYHHLEWKVPQFIHYGRLKMEDVALSTSKARLGIEEGLYSGWDDPQLGTLQAIARRGIQPQALHDLMLEIGVKIADSTISWKKIYGLNRQLLEEKANRYFLVTQPQLIEIKGIPPQALGIVERPLHPDHLDRGMRKLHFDGKVYLSQHDIPADPEKVLRLMDAINITFTDGKAQYHSPGIKEAREQQANLIQWVPYHGAIETEIIMPDAEIVPGYAESSLSSVKVGEVVQLERMGFARLDNREKQKIRFYYAHK